MSFLKSLGSTTQLSFPFLSLAKPRSLELTQDLAPANVTANIAGDTIWLYKAKF